jgi:hypothetical protein
VEDGSTVVEERSGGQAGRFSGAADELVDRGFVRYGVDADHEVEWRPIEERSEVRVIEQDPNPVARRESEEPAAALSLTSRSDQRLEEVRGIRSLGILISHGQWNVASSWSLFEDIRCRAAPRLFVLS